MNSPKKGKYKRYNNCKGCGSQLKSVWIKDLLKGVTCKVCKLKQ